jgi:hypothetical protein
MLVINGEELDRLPIIKLHKSPHSIDAISLERGNMFYALKLTSLNRLQNPFVTILDVPCSSASDEN